MVLMKESTYRNAAESYRGFCTKCERFTTDDGVEPDAEGYECPRCGESTVMGAEQALIMGLIGFK